MLGFNPEKTIDAVFNALSNILLYSVGSTSLVVISYSFIPDLLSDASIIILLFVTISLLMTGLTLSILSISRIIDVLSPFTSSAYAYTKYDVSSSFFGIIILSLFSFDKRTLFLFKGWCFKLFII